MSLKRDDSREWYGLSRRLRRQLRLARLGDATTLSIQGLALTMALGAVVLAGAMAREPSIDSSRVSGGMPSSSAGELSLDRGSVLALIQAGMPGPLHLTVPGLGSVTVVVEPPISVDFVQGGVEGEFLFKLDELDLSTSVQVRYVPETEAKSGTVRLVAESAIAADYLPASLDLAPLLPPADLPRALDWSLTGLDGQEVSVRCHVQGVEVAAERLTVQLGFVAR